MVEVLTSLLVFALFIIAGFWGTIRAQREQLSERDEQIAALKDAVPPRAVQFVVDPNVLFASPVDDRATEPGDPPTLDLASLGNDRQTLA